MSATAAAFETITSDLARAFADRDVAYVADTVEWALRRVAAVREFKHSAEGIALARRDQSAYYEQLFAMSGGKTWYKAFDGRSLDDVARVARKNAEGTLAARNASIAAKLLKAEITSVTWGDVVRTADGFNGTYVVMTAKGDKTVHVQTIYAGGYNSQCFHQRTLISVK